MTRSGPSVPGMTHDRPAPTPPAHQIVTGTARLVRALQEYVQTIRQSGDLHIVALPHDLENLVKYVESGTAQHEFAQLARAWELVETDAPIRGGTPGTARERPERWQGPLRPYELLTWARDAPRSEPGYRTHLIQNATWLIERQHRLERQRPVPCGRQTTGGWTCRANSIYVPADEYGATATGWPCLSHATPEETRAIADMYATAETLDCPGCDAAAGEPCWTDTAFARRRRIVHGDWPRIRSLRGRKIHDARLVLTLSPRT